MTDRYGDRPDTPAARPAPTITSKARSDELIVTHTHTHLRAKRTGTMRERLRAVDEPAPTLAFGHNAAGWEWVLNRRQSDVPVVTADRPAPTLTAAAGAKSLWQWEAAVGDSDGTEAIKLTLEEAMILQGFDRQYPLQGSRSKKFEQVGNAVPPPLALAVLRALTEG